MSYKAEEAKLKSLIDEEVWDLLKANKAIIAGGAITSLFTNKEVNDLDIYLPSERAVVNILAESFSQEEFTETYDYLGQFQLRFMNLSDKSILFKNGEQPVQLITFKYFNTAEEIFDTFDFTCCMGAYDMVKEEFILHPDFMKHNAQKYLKFNNGTAFPIMSALRVDKYKEKGYSISKSEYLRVVLQCLTLELNSWEDAKEHIGGMYGYDMDDFFDEEKEFSVPELVGQLGERDYDNFNYPEVEMDFVKILNKFDPAEEISTPEPPYREGYYYKHVGENLFSHSTYGMGTPIYYEIGSIVNGGEKGIFIHKDPTDPWVSNGVCIELEPVGEAKVVFDEDTASLVPFSYDRRKGQAFGDFRVVRKMPYFDTTGPTKAEIKYLVEDGNG